MRDDLPEALQAAGFEVQRRDPYSFYLGCVQMVLREGDELIGVADPRFARPMCIGEVKPKGQDELLKDIANLKSAMAKHGATRGFMNAASPGVISLFLQNDFYPTRDAYLAALADAMKEEYETIVAAGLDLQLDCPDLALSRHMLFNDLTDDEFDRIVARVAHGAQS